MRIVKANTSAVSYSHECDHPDCPSGQRWGYISVVVLGEDGRVYQHARTFAPRDEAARARALAERIASAGRINPEHWRCVADDAETSFYFLRADGVTPLAGVILAAA